VGTDMSNSSSCNFDIAIVGAGPAGLADGLYAGRNRMRTALLEARAPGGQLLNTELIEDYPGQQSILGGDLAAIMLEQALHFGAELITGLVDAHLEHDSAGYYVTDPHTMMTNIPGIFAAGDVRSQLTRQITTAVGDATTATMAAMRWVEDTKRRVDVGTAEHAQLVA